MTEVRAYSTGDSELLAEEFRLKLNSYVYAIRSGQPADSGRTEATGFDIVLFGPDEPPDVIKKMIDVAGQTLATEDTPVSWQILDQLREITTTPAVGPSELTRPRLKELEAYPRHAAHLPRWWASQVNSATDAAN